MRSCHRCDTLACALFLGIWLAVALAHRSQARDTDVHLRTQQDAGSVGSPPIPMPSAQAAPVTEVAHGLLVVGTVVSPCVVPSLRELSPQFGHESS
jgi:hypothetical protein